MTHTGAAHTTSQLPDMCSTLCNTSSGNKTIVGCEPNITLLGPHVSLSSVRLCVQREVFGDTFDLSTADATDLPPETLVPGMAPENIGCVLSTLNMH